MQQLSVLDTWFIQESNTTFNQIVDALVFEPEERSLSMPELRAVVEQRLHLLPPLRRRLVEVPFGMDEPYWIEDPDFDLSNHLHEATLPEPGDDRQLAAHAAVMASKPLDRSRPLWELQLVHGLEGGRVAVFKKMHHAAVDGASGIDVTTILLDRTPEPPAIPPPEPWVPDPIPSDPEMMMRGMAGLARRPLRMLDTEGRMLERIPWFRQARRDTTDEATRDGELLWKPPRNPPRTPLNAKITADRSVAFGTLSLDELKSVKNRFGVTLNDVVIALCAGSVRRWLQARDALPNEPLLVCVPVSVRTEEQKGAFGNRVSMMIAEFPTHLADPGERVRAAHEAMKAAKEQHKAIGAEILTDMGMFAMPAVEARASRVLAQMGAEVPVEARPFMWNVAVSNVPGPRETLYLGGHPLEVIKPVGFLADELGLMIALISYRDRVGFGALAEPHLVPDVWSIADGVRDALAELL
jgi:diacylglycerol O-acyltransferase / wax synthase